jgi:hypothetical protein
MKISVFLNETLCIPVEVHRFPGAYFFLATCLAYSSTLKMENTVPLLIFTGRA